MNSYRIRTSLKREHHEYILLLLFERISGKRTESRYEHVSSRAVTPTTSPLGIRSGLGASACTKPHSDSCLSVVIPRIHIGGRAHLQYEFILPSPDRPHFYVVKNLIKLL